MVNGDQQNMGISPNNLVSLRCQEKIHLVNDASQIHGQIIKSCQQETMGYECPLN